MLRRGLVFLLFAATVAGVAHLGTSPISGQTAPVVRTGTLTVVWGDPHPASSAAPTMTVMLTDAAGEWSELTFDAGVLEAAGGLRWLNGQTVNVVGRTLVTPEAGASERIGVARLTPAIARTAESSLQDGPTAVTGSQPWVTILCRFADSPSVTPREPAYFDGMFGAASPGLDHYWRELSYDAISTAAAPTVGWFNLPSPRSAYMLANGNPDLTKLKNDCAALADPVVYFPNLAGISFGFNQDFACCAYGGGSLLNLDGVNKVYRTTWMPPWAFEWGTYAHEMGHGFGFPHSSGPYGTPYDSLWDPMSAHNFKISGPYGRIPAHTISYHKSLAGWIPDNRRFVGGAGVSVVTIERLSQPPADGSYLMARVPIGGSTTRFYTVEARRFVGRDAAVPLEAIVIHNVDETRADRDAQVVDATPDNNPNDAGAAWIVGETFTDSINQISISVVAAPSTGWTVSITNVGACAFSIAPTGVFIGGAGGTRTASVTTQAGCPWTAVSNQAFVSVTGGASGVGSGDVSYSVSPNTGAKRVAALTIAGLTLPITQEAPGGILDFDGDGRLDLLWHHQTTGQISGWLMDGTQMMAGTLLTPTSVPDTNWKCVGAGDLDGDGQIDLVWQNIADGRTSAWLMNGLTQREGALFSIPQVADLQWKIRSVGDLNGDGKADLLWQHEGTGAIAAWLMNGLTVVSGIALTPSQVADLSWKIVGTADFDGNGSRDLVWHHQGDGRIAVWYMNGTTQISGSVTNPASVPDLSWKIRAIGDLNGDGKPDFLWQNIADGRISAWLMNGLNLVSGTLLSVPQVADTNWQVVGPR